MYKIKNIILTMILLISVGITGTQKKDPNILESVEKLEGVELWKQVDAPKGTHLPYVVTPIKIDILLNKQSTNELVIYFKNYDSMPYLSKLSPLLSRDKNKVLTFFELDNLNNHYERTYIKLKNGSKFLYGKFILHDEIKLELHYVDKNNKKVVEIYYKTAKNGDNINEIIEKINGDKTEGVYEVPRYNEEITIITSERILYKAPKYFKKEEKELYDILMELFKEEIPKEYFEIRDTTDKTYF